MGERDLFRLCVIVGSVMAILAVPFWPVALSLKVFVIGVLLVAFGMVVYDS